MMAAYWKSVQRIVSGEPGAAILRLRSRYEPDPAAGHTDNPAEHLEAEVEVAADTGGLSTTSRPHATRGQDWAAPVQPLADHERASPDRSGLAEHLAGFRAEPADAQNDVYARPAPDRLPADRIDLEPPRHSGQPQGPYAGPVDRFDHAREVPDSLGLDVGPGIETERSGDRKAGAGGPEISAAAPDVPDRGDDRASAPADDDRQARWLAELRAELDAAIDLASTDAEGARADNAPAQPDVPRPIVVEIDHLELAIMRPAPPAAHRPPRQDRASPVITLEAYLSHTGSGGA